MNIRVKVCGMTLFNQVLKLNELGVDFLGFIFYDKSPRYVGNNFTEDQIKYISNVPISKVGVFVNEPIMKLIEMVRKWKLDCVQLHGEEPPDYCSEVVKHCNVIKAFRVSPADNLEKVTKAYKDVDFFLFDTKGALLGGTGQKFNWEQLLVPLQHPYFMSGGISIDDIEQIRKFKMKSDQLYAVDVNSTFEIKPGIKNIDRVADFIDKLKKMDYE